MPLASVAHSLVMTTPILNSGGLCVPLALMSRSPVCSRPMLISSEDHRRLSTIFSAKGQERDVAMTRAREHLHVMQPMCRG